VVITTDEFLTYCDIAWDGYAAIAQELGEDLINARPDVVGANTAYGLIAHVVGVAGRWARTVNHGIVVPRHRTSRPSTNPPGDQPAQSCGAVLHVYEELAQHLGQLEVIRDVLLARPARP